MTWYRTGTVTVTNGSPTVTGIGTAFVANAQIGEGFLAPDGRIYEITNIPSDTALTISPNYLGSTASGQVYAIAPLRGRIAQLLAETSSLLGSFAAVRDGIGAGLFPDGTVSLPGLRFAADQDTGLRRVENNAMALVTGGTDQVRVNADGSVGIGSAGSEPGLSILVASEFAMGLSARTSSPQTLILSHPVALLDNTNTTIGNGISLRYRIADTGGTLRTAAGIGTVATAKTASTITTDMYFYVGSDERLRIFSGGAVIPGADNTQTLGNGATRWSTVFAATGTINTSDEREKAWRGPLTAAELAAAKRIAGEIGVFQWNDAIAEKGPDGARLHFGVKAQQVWEIMADEGLVDPIGADGLPGATPYAFLCFDAWEAVPGSPAIAEVRSDDGEIIREAIPAVPDKPAGNRYGLRLDQLALFLIAAQESRLAALEAAA